MILDFERCRKVWVPDESEAGGFWSPPPPHVRVGVDRILSNHYFLLADDMGGMKTAQAIIAAQFLHDAHMINRVIVVAPAAIRAKVWFDKDLGQLIDQVFLDKNNMVTEYHAKRRMWQHGPKDQRELRWIITNYEFIRMQKNLDELLQYVTEETLLILDESSAVRTWDSKQTFACNCLRWLTNNKGRPVMGKPRAGRILMLNGTPVAESPLDLFSQCNMLHPDILDCRYISHFKARYAIQEPIRGSGGQALVNPRNHQPLMVVSQWTNLEDIQRRMAPYVLRREAKDLGIDFALPPVGIDVPLTPATWKAYCEMRDELVVWLKSGVATAATAAVKGMRLAQITSGFVGGIEDSGLSEGQWLHEPSGEIPEELRHLITYMEDHQTSYSHEDIAKAKTERMNGVTAANLLANHDVVEVGREKLDFALAWQADLLKKDPNLKLLTWCRFVPELKRYLWEVQQKFQHPVGAAAGQKILRNMGSQKQEREDALRLLHPKTAPAGPVTVGATQGTGAMGLNFTACRTVLDLSYDFSPFKKRQGDARVNRPGQTGKVSFFYLVAIGPKGQKTIDHHIMMTRLGKMNVNDLTVAAWVSLLQEE